jgi:tetratricopeptide (TPR) repeat protein
MKAVRIVAGVLGMIFLAGMPGPAAAGPAPASERHREAYYYYSLSQAERLRRNYLQAAKHLRKAIELDPQSVYLHLDLARLQRTLRQTPAALEEINTALRLNPADGEAHRLAAEIHADLMEAGTDTQDNLQRAIEHYEKAMAALPDEEEIALALGRLYYYRGDSRHALSALQRYQAQSPDSAEAHFWLAKVHLSQQNLDAAESSLRRSLEQLPHHYESLMMLVGIQEMRERYAEAMATCERALAVAQDGVEARYALARLALKQSDFKRAAREYLALLSLMKQRRPWISEAELADLYLFAARAQWFGDSPEPALATVREGGAEFRADARFRLLEGELLMDSGRGGEGEAMLEDVLLKGGGDRETRERVADAYFNQGAARERKGEYAEAERLLKRAIAIHAEHASALNYLGYMLLETTDRYSESLGYIERAVALDPDNGDYLDSLGWVYYKLNRLEEAEKQLRRALERADEDAVIHDHLGDVALGQGRPQEALQHWEAALEDARGLDKPDKIREKIQSLRQRTSDPKR